MRLTRSKWFVPVLSVALGIVVLAAQWIGGDPGSGLESLGIMTGFGALILLGGRSETIRGLRGDGRDERFRQIDIHATALAGLAVISAHRRIPDRARARAQRHAVQFARRDRWLHLPRSNRHLQNPRIATIEALRS
jgi:hypothetical protein